MTDLRVHLPRVPSALGRFKTTGVCLIVLASAWIGGCGSGDPASPTTWQQVASTHTSASDTPDGAVSSGDTDAAPLSSVSATTDAAVDSGPVQTYRNPDGAVVVGCTAPNILCPSGGASSSSSGDDDDDADAGPLVCVAAGTDPGNCGACGNVCNGADATCIGGQCACSGLHEDYCDGNCVDLDSDDDNCGACDVQCDSGQSCTGGACVDDD